MKYEFPKSVPEGGLYVKREKGQLSFKLSGNSNPRLKSVRALIELTCDTRDVQCDFPVLYFDAQDQPFKLQGVVDTVSPNYPAYTLSTSEKGNFEHANLYPDYIFDKWDGVYDDYEEYRIGIMSRSVRKPTTAALGWIGSVNCGVRERYVKLAREVGKDRLFYRSIAWTADPSEFRKINATKFMTLADQVSRFKYMFDMRGLGYTGRTKLLFFSHRPIFLCTPFKEYWYDRIEPWVHYVPVKPDLSDLLENLDRVDADSSLARSLANNAWEFGNENLTRDHALDEYTLILNKH